MPPRPWSGLRILTRSWIRAFESSPDVCAAGLPSTTNRLEPTIRFSSMYPRAPIHSRSSQNRPPGTKFNCAIRSSKKGRFSTRNSSLRAGGRRIRDLCYPPRGVGIGRREDCSTPIANVVSDFLEPIPPWTSGNHCRFQQCDIRRKPRDWVSLFRTVPRLARSNQPTLHRNRRAAGGIGIRTACSRKLEPISLPSREASSHLTRLEATISSS